MIKWWKPGLTLSFRLEQKIFLHLKYSRPKTCTYGSFVNKPMFSNKKLWERTWPKYRRSRNWKRSEHTRISTRQNTKVLANRGMTRWGRRICGWRETIGVEFTLAHVRFVSSIRSSFANRCGIVKRPLSHLFWTGASVKRVMAASETKPWSTINRALNWGG